MHETQYQHMHYVRTFELVIVLLMGGMNYCTFGTRTSDQDNKVILIFNQSFCQGLVVLHTKLSMFDKCSVHAWSLWRFEQEHTISVHWGSAHFSSSWHDKVSGPQ